MTIFKDCDGTPSRAQRFTIESHAGEILASMDNEKEVIWSMHTLYYFCSHVFRYVIRDNEKNRVASGAQFRAYANTGDSPTECPEIWADI